MGRNRCQTRAAFACWRRLPGWGILPWVLAFGPWVSKLMLRLLIFAVKCLLHKAQVQYTPSSVATVANCEEEERE